MKRKLSKALTLFPLYFYYAEKEPLAACIIMCTRDLDMLNLALVVWFKAWANYRYLNDQAATKNVVHVKVVYSYSNTHFTIFSVLIPGALCIKLCKTNKQINWKEIK